MTETTTAKTPRIIKAGGAKGVAVVALLTQDPALTRGQLAKEIGCTVGRVGEVVRYLRDHGSKEEQALIAKHVKAQPQPKGTTKATPKTVEAKPTKRASRPRKPAAPKEA